MDNLERHACFGGEQSVWKHRSKVLGCEMSFAVFTPEHAPGERLPVVYFLAGLTCNEQNFITKAGAQRYAAQHRVILVAPDTSPRGADVADDPAYDLGQGAGFYLNATEAPWAAHYKMHDYIVSELPALIEAEFPASNRRSIMGHSMGGHGALVLSLRNLGRYRAVSAFAPIVAPSAVPWGEKAFSAYLGADRSTWAAWDACALLEAAREPLPMLIDQGEADNFLENQLQPERLAEIAARWNHALTLRRHAGYDHSYYFIASFIGDHIAHHAAALHG